MVPSIDMRCKCGRASIFQKRRNERRWLYAQRPGRFLSVSRQLLFLALFELAEVICSI